MLLSDNIRSCAYMVRMPILEMCLYDNQHDIAFDNRYMHMHKINAENTHHSRVQAFFPKQVLPMLFEKTHKEHKINFTSPPSSA